MNSINYYTDIFKVTEEQMRTVTRTALSRGGDYSDLYFEYTTYFNLLLKDGEVSSGGFHTDFGVGIRVLKGEKTGYAYSENTDINDMLKAARAASAIAAGAGDSKTYNPVTERHIDIYPVKNDWRAASASTFLPFLKSLEKKVFAKDSRIVKVIARLADSVSDVMMYNSLGELTYDTRPMGSVTVTAVFQQDGKTENKSASRSFRIGSELITESLADELACDVVKGIDARFEAVRPKGGQMNVVMGAGASGILLHEAMGHAFEADFNRKGQSIFSDKMGCKVLFISDDLPPPETPVTHISFPSGNSTSTFLRLLPRAPNSFRDCPLPARRCFGTEISSLPLRKRAVMVSPLSISVGVPAKTISPPLRPAFGPRSMI